MDHEEFKKLENLIGEWLQASYKMGNSDLRELVIKIIDKFPDITLLDLKDILKSSAEYFPNVYLRRYEKVYE